MKTHKEVATQLFPHAIDSKAAKNDFGMEVSVLRFESGLTIYNRTLDTIQLMESSSRPILLEWDELFEEYNLS